MKLGSLFSGGGLGDFGFLAAGMEIAWQCEIDKYCQEILQLRYPESKKYRDIKTLKGEALERVDIITGGFPCQPFSVAGKQRGKDDNRYLWPEMLRVIAECRPRWVVGENVPGIINMALDTVCADLEAQGYEVWPIVFPSHALGAWHKRDRIWIICHSKSEQDRRIQQSRIQSNIGTTSFKNSRRGSFTEEGNFGVCEYECNNSGICANPEHWYVADTNEQRSQGRISQELPECAGEQLTRSSGSLSNSKSDPWGIFNRDSKSDGYFWDIEPAVGRVANGIADRVHRLKMLGNGQVPACTYVIGKMIMDIEGLTPTPPKKDEK